MSAPPTPLCVSPRLAATCADGKPVARELLEEIGLRRTVARALVLDGLLRREGPGEPFTPASLHASLSAQGHAIGMATIYRVLAALQDAGLVEVRERQPVRLDA